MLLKTYSRLFRPRHCWWQSVRVNRQLMQRDEIFEDTLWIIAAIQKWFTSPQVIWKNFENYNINTSSLCKVGKIQRGEYCWREICHFYLSTIHQMKLEQILLVVSLVTAGNVKREGELNSHGGIINWGTHVALSPASLATSCSCLIASLLYSNRCFFFRGKI